MTANCMSVVPVATDALDEDGGDAEMADGVVLVALESPVLLR